MSFFEEYNPNKEYRSSQDYKPYPEYKPTEEYKPLQEYKPFQENKPYEYSHENKPSQEYKSFQEYKPSQDYKPTHEFKTSLDNPYSYQESVFNPVCHYSNENFSNQQKYQTPTYNTKIYESTNPYHIEVIEPKEKVTRSAIISNNYEKIVPYDYRTYKPLDHYNSPQVLYEKISYSPNEKPKKTMFHEYNVPEYETSKRISFKLDQLKDDIVDIRNKISLSPQRISYSQPKVTYSPQQYAKPRIFEEIQPIEIKPIEVKPIDNLRVSSPLFIEKAEYIKKSGTSSYNPLKSRTEYIKRSTSPLNSPPLITSMRKTNSHKSKIFSPLRISEPVPDLNLSIKKHESPISQYYPYNNELPKKSYQKFEPYGKSTSHEIVVPSRTPIHTELDIDNRRVYQSSSPQTITYRTYYEPISPPPHISVEQKALPEISYSTYQPIKENKPEEQVVFKRYETQQLTRRATDTFDSIFCIDCEQYIKASNANLHSLFCYKDIESSGNQTHKIDIRGRLRNIVHFFLDEMIRIKMKGGAKDTNFWENCEDLKKCLNDIIECKREADIYSHIDRLHYINLKFDKVSSPYAHEIQKLGLKAEEDLKN